MDEAYTERSPEVESPNRALEAARPPFVALRDELYEKLLAEDPSRPQYAITLATLYARFETEIPSTMADLRGVLAALQGVFGNTKSSKLLSMLGVKS